MATLRSYTIDATKQARIRAGIKWDPLERDDIDELHAFGSAQAARKKLASTRRHLARLSLFARFLHKISLFNRWGRRIDRMRQHKLAEKKALETTLAQEKLHSYDLDLCCFCYDKAGKLVGFALPDFTEMHGKAEWQSSFLHSGDDTTGTGDAFDEELLINLHTADKTIHTIFLVVLSIHHGFDEINGGFWSVVHTMGEKELMSAFLKTTEKHRTHVIAALTRDENSWTVKEIAEYCPIENNEKNSLQKRIDQMLRSRYPVMACGSKDDR